ncbi:hypothetical protein [Herbaspirillum frisingense]|uniref:Uncharacterized protein n=1 Tax=Herbaspirillum frisingense TaxID=92645 RepID=A0ABU1PEF9_9BURK|nr:hypothetical protein [Herbaspirillum frisingense]MDR6583548.1 hypothetical protein [Herbaspirillum frisingense]
MNSVPQVTTALTVFIPPRDFMANPPQSQDRITFNTAEDGVLAGFVAAVRHHLGNGERFAWVELDNELAGQFRGVPLVDIISSDDCGGARRLAAAVNDARRLCLADFSGTLADHLRTVRA